MSKLQPPTLTARHSTQAVSGTTIGAEHSSPADRRGEGQFQSDQSTGSPSQSSAKFPQKSPQFTPSDSVEDDGLTTINSAVSGSIDVESDDDNLQHILNGLIREENEGRPDSRSVIGFNEGANDHANGHLDPFKASNESYMDLNIFPNTNNVPEEEYFAQRISIEKSLTQSQFYKKLKHFMIFSSAGKPIYSMNGTDDVIMGYTGLITTMISTFEDTMNEQIKVIDMNGLKISLLNKSPIILVSITKIKYEMALNQNTNEHTLIARQLESLYNYLLSILSKPVLNKHFQNRMNFDLRKVLTPVDFSNLDTLCFQSTYGLNENNYKLGLEYYISQLLDSSFPTIRLTNTIRTTLNSILLKSKSEVAASDNYDDYNEDNSKTSGSDAAHDYLFGIILKDNHLVSLLKPKNYDLSNKDLNNLLLIISNNEHKNDKVAEELWLPVCMPNFNTSGFLYIYVKTYKLLRIILISTNKNNFYKLQDRAQLIINKLEMENFKKIYQALNNHELTINAIVPKSIIHFIYKDKTKNQFISSGLKFNKSLNLKLIYYYGNLYNSKSNTIKSLINNKSDKKLTYLKFNNEVGFMISDKRYEFYCISTEFKLVNLIDASLTIIKWCKQNHKRLYNNVVEYSL